MVSHICVIYERGVKLDEDVFVRKFRFNQTFRPLNAEEFMKAILNSK